jgi:NodT family efflux transporter outer membrane factor (OMF) lipoprotein
MFHPLTRPAVLAAASTALLLAACSFTPRENATPPTLPPAWSQAAPAAGWQSAEQARDWAAGAWWRLFEDPVLDGLMARVDVGNQNLAVAAANVAQAEALLRQQQAGYWPTLTASASAQRGVAESQPVTRSASTNLAASWSPDLWGRVGDAVKGQSALAQASRADLAAARLSAQATLANAYFALREADAETALIGDIVAGYERSARIALNRYDAGVAPRTDTYQAELTLRNAQATRQALARSRALSEHAIALLIGEAPARLAIESATGTTAWAGKVPAIPAGLPSALLLRRPDVASLERAVASTNLQIGVAKSAYFPNFSLSRTIGATAPHLLELASAPNLLWSMGLSLTQTVIDGGARGARVEQAEAAHDAAVARYRQAALTAMREVEDQLSSLATLDTQIAHARAAANAAQRIEQQFLNRYQAGLSAYTEVVTAQASALTARRTVLQLLLSRQQAAVTLVQALGGGWEADWVDELARNTLSKQ